MKKNDKFIGDLLAQFDMKFNKIDNHEDPKFVEPRKKESLEIKLKKAERERQKVQKLGPEQSKKLHWKKAMDKANGLKVKDDPKLLKKAIKKRDDLKNRHRKKWQERVEKQQAAKGAKKTKKGKKSSMKKSGPSKTKKPIKANKKK